MVKINHRKKERRKKKKKKKVDSILKTASACGKYLNQIWSISKFLRVVFCNKNMWLLIISVQPPAITIGRMVTVEAEVV